MEHMVEDHIPVLGVPVLNRFELLEEFFKSIDFPIRDFIVINNNKDYDISPIKHPLIGRMHVLNMPNNIGVAASWNLVIKSFPHEDFWVIGSNDITWESGTLEQLCQESSKDRLMLSSQAWSAFSIGSNIIKSVGIFDENYYPAYYEDTDYMERIRLLGLSDKVSQLSFSVNAYDSATTMKSDLKFIERNKETKESNRLYFMEKIYQEDEDLNIMGFDWSLQRRIDNDWTN